MTCAKEMGFARIFQIITNIYYQSFTLTSSQLSSTNSELVDIIITTMSGIKPTPFHTRNPLANRNINSILPLSAHKQQPHLRTVIDHSLLDTQECTFEPKTNNHSHSKRSLDRFLRDQQAFQHSREHKIQQLRSEKKQTEESQVTHSPMINQGSRRIAGRQGSTDNIFQRLSTRPPQRIHTAYSFSPQILDRSQSIKRTADVSSLLYNDARRRQEKSQFLAQTQRSLTDRASTTPKINDNAGRLAAKKVLSQLAGLIRQEQVSPLVAVLALEDLFNVDLNPARQGQTLRKLLSYISHLNDQHVEVVSTSVVRQFVSIVVGAEYPCTHFNLTDQQTIFQEFRYFNKEKICKERRQPTVECPSFQPQTLEASNKLAQCYREKACQKVEEFLQGQHVNLSLREGEITIEELFILNSLRKKQENEKKRQQKEKKELEECTFKPKITPIASLEKSRQEQKKPKITLKTIKKISLKPCPQQKNKVSKQKENVDYKSALHLPPRSDKKPQRCSITNNESILKDMQKIVLRMSAGRQKREFSNTVTERGYPKDQNWTQLQKDMHRASVQNLQKMRRLSFKA